jgi:hypothetical protein
MNTHLIQNQKTNIFKTWFYLLVFALLLVLVGFIAASIFGNINFLYMGLGMAVMTNFFSYFFSDSIVLKMSNAKPLGDGDDAAFAQHACSRAQVSANRGHAAKVSNAARAGAVA